VNARVVIADGEVVKTYADAATCRQAQLNYAILSGLSVPDLHLPRLQATDDHQTVFTLLPGRAAVPTDLPRIAKALGHLHRLAFATHLRSARLDRPFTIGGTVVLGFTDQRHQRSLAGLAEPDHGSLLTARDIEHLFAMAGSWSAALYKDANPRNFLIAADAPIGIIDFDDLTLAPFGYDLAKLIVTLAMTHGALESDPINEALRQYNQAATDTPEQDAPCPPQRLAMFCELHHLFTAPYAGQHGYRHRWPDVRPWIGLKGD
jgi:hypothetical protein